MPSEAETAFYKGVKFWLTLLLAALLAALLWRLWHGSSDGGEQDARRSAQRVSYIL